MWRTQFLVRELPWFPVSRAVPYRDFHWGERAMRSYSGCQVAHCVTADEKMSENAGIELTHRTVQASFTRISWRCLRDFAEGGTSERDLRDERSGPFHPGDRRGLGHSLEHGSPVPQVPGSHAAEAPATADVQPLDKLGRIPRRTTSTGGCRKGWKTVWCCTGS